MVYLPWLFLLSLLIQAATPAGQRHPQRLPEGHAILPGGRIVTPMGTAVATGPGTFGLAMRADGLVATADGGPNRYSITLWDGQQKRTLLTKRRQTGEPEGEEDEQWRSVFMGLAFINNDELCLSEGESGRVRCVRVSDGTTTSLIRLNDAKHRDSYSGDIAIDRQRELMFVVDQANFRLVVIDLQRRAPIASVRTGRLPFAVTLANNGQTALVTNTGLFEYSAVPGVDRKQAKETGLPFPAFGFPSKEAERGVQRTTERGKVKVPGLGPLNVAEANSLAIVDVSSSTAPKVTAQIRTGQPIGGSVDGGSGPAGVLAVGGQAYVSNANQDTITVVDLGQRRVASEIALRIPGYEQLRGVMPIGLAHVPQRDWLLVAEAGINAVAVIERASGRVLGHLPAAWFPTRAAVREETVLVASAKGLGTGPNATAEKALERSFQADLRRGLLTRFTLPAAAELPRLTAQVLANNGFAPGGTPGPLPQEVQHVVIIVKENRTYDEVFGGLPAAANGPREGAPRLMRFGPQVAPNHHALALRFAASDHFYSDSEVSVDGHHWLVGSYPNAWTESTLMAAYGGQKSFRLGSAPGRLSFPESASSVHPEDLLEHGALWHHLARHKVPFLNFGEGFELAGIDEGKGLEPTGARFVTNMPMPEPLYRNTVRTYPGYNMNVPDQFRADQFIRELRERFEKPKKALPRLLYVHLPNDHMARPQPDAGYPVEASYVADNDLALGRILDYLSHSPWWPRMAVLVTEDDPQGGVDHIDSHRTVLLVASPYAKRNYNGTANTSFPGLLRTAFRLLGVPPLNLYDAAATDLAECFTSQPDLTPYNVLPVDKNLFDPARVRPNRLTRGPAMDDPDEIRRQHQARRPLP